MHHFKRQKVFWRKSLSTKESLKQKTLHLDGNAGRSHEISYWEKNVKAETWGQIWVTSPRVRSKTEHKHVIPNPVFFPLYQSALQAFALFLHLSLKVKTLKISRWHTALYSFPSFEPVSCSMSSSMNNCCFLTSIQMSQETSKVVWYSQLSKNFPQL